MIYFIIFTQIVDRFSNCKETKLNFSKNYLFKVLIIREFLSTEGLKKLYVLLKITQDSQSREKKNWTSNSIFTMLKI